MAARESLGTLPLLLERENSGTFSEGSPAVYSLYVCKAFLISLERLGIPTPGFSVPRLLAKVNEVIEKIKVAEGMSSKELPDPSARGPVEDIADFFNGVALKISLLAEDGGHVVLRYQNLQPEVSRGERIPRYMVYDILSGPERSYRGYVTLTTDGQKVQSSQINFRHGKGDAFLSRCIGDFLREPEKYLLNSARSGVQSFNPEDPRLRRSYRSGMDDISIGEPGLSNGWNVTFGAGSRGGVADAVKAAYEPGTVETWGARLGVRGAIRFFRVLRAPLVEEIFGGFFIAKSSKSRLPLGHGVLPILGGVAAYALGGMNVAVWVYSLAFLASRIPFVFARHASPLQRLDAAVISLLALGFSFGLLMAGEFSLPAAGAALGFKLISHILVNFATVRVTREEELAYTVSQALRAQTLSRVEAAKMIQRNLRGNRLDLQIGETFDPDAAVEGLMAQAVKSQNDPAFLGTLAHALRSGDVPAGQLEGLFDSLMGRGRPVLSAAAIMNADGLPSLRNPFTLRVVRGGAAEADAASADLTASHRDADGRWRGLAVVVTDDRAVAERFSSRKEGDLLVVLAAEEEQPPATELHYMTLPRRKVFSSASGVEFLSLSAVEGTVRERLASFEARTGSITSSWFILPPGLPVLAEDYATDAFRQAVVIRLLDMLGGVRMTLQELRFLGRTLEAVASSA